MLKRLRKRLTIMCAATTGCILILMAISIVHIAEGHMLRRREAEFTSVFRSILYSLQNQKAVDYSWLSQNEFNGECLIHIENNGVPFEYTGNWDKKLRSSLIARVKEIAEERDITYSGVGKYELLLTFSDASRRTYYAGVAGVSQGESATILYILKSMENERRQLVGQRIGVACIVFVATCLLWLFAWMFTSHLIRPIEESRRRQTAFISSASHELRTPLTVIQTGVETMRKAPPDRLEHFISLIHLECERMARLIDDQLTLAGADNGTWPTKFEPADMEPLLIAALERHEEASRAKLIRLTLSLPESILPICYCDPSRIEQVLSILIDNAISYTEETGEVQISAKADERQIYVTVSDTGAGIPDEYKLQIFERFFRVDSARAQKDHFGLGLSIAKEIVEIHHGTICVRDAQKGGSEFIIMLPLRSV